MFNFNCHLLTELLYLMVCIPRKEIMMVYWFVICSTGLYSHEIWQLSSFSEVGCVQTESCSWNGKRASPLWRRRRGERNEKQRKLLLEGTSQCCSLYGGQFTLSTQLIILNYPVILSHWCCTIVSLETYPFIPFFLVFGSVSGWYKYKSN